MIDVRELTKYYGGKCALGPVSFAIEAGQSVGFLGLNGAGKSTLLRMLACDLRPSAGTFAVAGVDGVRDPHAIRTQVGFLSEQPPLYPEMRVGDYLRFTGMLRGMSAGAVARRLPAVEELTHVTDVHDTLIRYLSHGYRQRVGLAQAIVHEPSLVVLDEPTKGLDPAQIVEMRRLVRQLKDRHTVLISGHVLTEIQETCDRLFVIGGGRLVASGTERELTARLRSRTFLLAAEPGADGAAGVERALQRVSGVRRVVAGGTEDSALSYLVEADRDVRADLCRSVIDAGHAVVRLDRADHALESVFLELVQGASSGAGR